MIASIDFESDVRLSDMTVPLELIQKVYLMSCNSDDPDCSMPGGAITDFNIWDKSFSAADLQAWTACRYFLNSIQLFNFYKNIFSRMLKKGNIVNWDNAQWNFTNAVLGNQSLETVCNLPEARDVAFPERRTYEKHKLLCKAINGKVTVITSEPFQVQFQKMFLSTIPKSVLSKVKLHPFINLNERKIRISLFRLNLYSGMGRMG